MTKRIWENQRTLMRVIRNHMPKGLNAELQSEKGITLAETHFNDLGEPKQFTTMLVYFDWDN